MNAPVYKREFSSDVIPVDRLRTSVSRTLYPTSNKEAKSNRNHVLTAKLLLDMARSRFNRKYSTWRSQTATMSSPIQLTHHALWKELVAFDKLATQFAIERLQMGDRSLNLFVLLNQVNGFNAFDPSAAGNVHAMADAWIQWTDRK